MAQLIDRTGKVYGRLTVLRRAERITGEKHPYWICRCSCGRETRTCANDLISGDSKSCGCLKIEILIKRVRTHGGVGTRAYNSWRLAKNRCYNPRYFAFHRYGGRGIVMSDEWRNDFGAFIRDMGERPPGTELDRINNDGPYAPGNCRWATRRVQINNSTVPRFLEYNGQRGSVTEFAQWYGLPFSTLWARISSGWTVERALTTPLRRDKRRRR